MYKLVYNIVKYKIKYKMYSINVYNVVYVNRTTFLMVCTNLIRSQILKISTLNCGRTKTYTKLRVITTCPPECARPSPPREQSPTNYNNIKGFFYML